ncbi:MAG: ABC transporter, permease protein 2 (cluster 1, maltose/g3p/polyamine/iron), partial [uncultured Thermomicrobiales bacterium]
GGRSPRAAAGAGGHRRPQTVRLARCGRQGADLPRPGRPRGRLHRAVRLDGLGLAPGRERHVPLAAAVDPAVAGPGQLRPLLPAGQHRPPLLQQRLRRGHGYPVPALHRLAGGLHLRQAPLPGAGRALPADPGDDDDPGPGDADPDLHHPQEHPLLRRQRLARPGRPRLARFLLGADRAPGRQRLRHLPAPAVHDDGAERPAGCGPDRRRLRVPNLRPDRDAALPAGAGGAGDLLLLVPVGQLLLAAGDRQQRGAADAAAGAGALRRPQPDGLGPADGRLRRRHPAGRDRLPPVPEALRPGHRDERAEV